MPRSRLLWRVLVALLVAVSLSGEVCGSMIAKHYYSDVGGQFDFALGASWAPEGIAIIALPSVVHRAGGLLQSKIVALHTEGAHHTISADQGVGIAVSGVQNAGSYWYPGGLDLDVIPQ